MPKRQVLYITAFDPWDRWTNSGVVPAICTRLKKMGLLYGAWNVHDASFAELHGRSEIRHLMYRIRRRITKEHLKLRKAVLPPADERSGNLARLLSRVPHGTPVVYHYVLPIINPVLPIKRFLFQDITIDDALKGGGFGYNSLSPEQIAENKRFQKSVISNADGVLSFASFVADSLEREYGYPRSRVFPIGAGAIRRWEGVSEPTIERYQRKRILFVGRAFERKGGDTLLEAFKLVRQRVPDATLTIVSSMAKLGDAQVPLDGIEHIPFASNEQLHELYLNSSIFCMPTKCETWGLVFVEAASHALPIVGFDDWALPDIVDSGTTGLLTANRTPQGLADALVDALSDPARLHQMGKAALTRVRDVLEWPHVMDRFLSAVLPDALQGRQPVWMRPR